MSTTIILSILGYGVCSVLGYGITLAYFQQKYYDIRTKSDFGNAFFIGVLGPLGLVVALLLCEGLRYGLQFIPQDSGWRRDDTKYKAYLDRKKESK